MLFLILSSCFSVKAQLNIIPAPVSTDMMFGNFKFNSNTKIVLVDDVDEKNKAEVLFFNEWLQNYYGYKLELINYTKNQKNLIYINSVKNESEKYEFQIKPEQIVIKAKGEGLKNAFESLKQLIFDTYQQHEAILPACYISDSARFEWRGMHLDVCRHFFSKDEVKKYIDLISMYKMNVFHWHLTDDQGWRIEIKKYPMLTQKGAWRKGSMIGHYTDHKFDTLRYGGFYTQQDIKEVVAYAASKHVTIIPEIEMPGHALAALAAYPELACNDGPFEVEKKWGVFDDVFCPKPETFEFLENVLLEVMSLFPGQFIHIGGDECPKTRWKKCSHCQKLIKEKGLKDEHELQSYFIQTIEKFLTKHQKKIIGWDEILEGGLPPQAAVMSWRGTEGGIAAAKQHHEVVMTPGSHCYFDHYQGHPAVEPLAIGGFTPLEKVYHFNPVPEALNENERSFILGAQGNLWTEYLTSFDAVCYNALPRMAALSEVVWSPEQNKDLTGFLKRTKKHLKYLNFNKIPHSESLYNITYKVKTDSSTYKTYLYLNNVLFENNANDSTDLIMLLAGSRATQTYKEPIMITSSFHGGAQYFTAGKPFGKYCGIDIYYHKGLGKKITFTEPPSTYYNKGNLLDGMRGYAPRINEEWLAWTGKDMEATIDLKRIDTLSAVTIGCLKNETDWIYLPHKIELYTSADNNTFTPITTPPNITSTKDRYSYSYTFKPTPGRYVKVKVYCAPLIPAEKNGAGNRPWLFVDEIEIN